MNKTIVITVGAILLGITLFVGGTLFGQSRWSMMNEVNNGGYGYMTGNVNMPNNMMNNENIPSNVMNGNMANVMMSGQMGNMMNSDMMGMMAILYNDYDGDPLSIEDAETAVQTYIDTLQNDNLTLGEVMIFSNHAYAQILDESTGLGAYEVLVDPETLQVYPEPGPNMMWNGNYDYGSGMYGSGMMMGQNGMMGQIVSDDAEMRVDVETAVTMAQQHLDTYMPDMIADETVDVFSGYYTMHILEDGEVTGMLSVNGYTQQVMVHTWHGDFIEMNDDHD